MEIEGGIKKNINRKGTEYLRLDQRTKGSLEVDYEETKEINDPWELYF